MENLYNPLISIITVCLNAGKTIEKTIQSVINQRYNKIEYIIIDGGSTDETLEIIYRYRDYIDYMISQKDRGMYEAMNKGIAASHGDYLLFINADDWLVDNSIENAVNYIIRNEADVFYGSIYVYDENITYLKEPYELDTFYWTMPIEHQATFIKRCLTLSYDEDYKIASDYKLLLHMFYEGKKFKYMPYTIAYFRCGGISYNQNYDYIRVIEHLNIAAEEMLEFIGNLDKNTLERRVEYKWYVKRMINLYIDSDIENDIRNRNYISPYFECLLKLLDPQKRIVIFGCGDAGKSVVHFLNMQSINVLYFIDNDKRKWGDEIDKIRVDSPQRILDESNIMILVFSKKGCEQIKNQLFNMGIRNSDAICDSDTIINIVKKTYREKYIDKIRTLIPTLYELSRLYLYT